ncbi:MAG: hypothetical protein ACRYFY_19490 [Janthinobacterium lividum]
MVEIDMLATLGIAKPRKKIAQRQLELRQRLWPEITNSHIWRRQYHHGFTTIPRTMPLILSIIDDLAATPVSMAYLELWGRAFDEGFVTLSRPREIAFHAGFDGQRGERTWRTKMKSLAELGFIEVAGGSSGAMSYALILNPYLVIRRLYERGTPGLRQDKYNALMERAGEIGAEDFSLPDPWTPVPPAPAAAILPVAAAPTAPAAATG